MNLLVIEHHRHTCRGLCQTLSRLAFVEAVRSCDSGDAVETEVSQFGPDLIFLDARLMQCPAGSRVSDLCSRRDIPLLICTETFALAVIPVLNEIRRWRAVAVQVRESHRVM